MTAQTDITPVPVRECPPWLFKQGALFASDQDGEARTRLGEPARILIVEDDLLVAAQIETALTEAGFDIVGVAATSEEALELANTDRPDLAIMDIKLAGVRDGIDTAHELFRLHEVRCV